MQLGIRAVIYTRNHERAEAARLIAAAGFAGVQMASHYVESADLTSGQPRMGPGVLGAEFAAETRELFHAAGLQTWCLDCYNPLSGADETMRTHAVEQMIGGLRIARSFGCDAIVTEAGSRGVDGFERFLDSMRRVLPVAEEEDVAVCIEPSYAQSVPSCWAMAGAIEELGSPYLRVLLDPANILVYDSVDRMFSVLAGSIMYMHAKDCVVGEKAMPTFPSAGEGMVDWHRTVELMNEHGIDRLIIEYAREETLEQVAGFLRGVISEVEGS